MNRQKPVGAPASVARNIDAVVRAEQEALQPRSRGEAFVDAVGGFVGTITFVLAQLLASTGWMAVNSGWLGVKPFDPFPFSLLSAVTSVEAVLVSAIVLMKQNRMSTVENRRDHLDLQVNLRTERQATQILQMLDRLSAHVGLEHHHDADGRELSEPVAIEHLVDELHRRLPGAPGSG